MSPPVDEPDSDDETESEPVRAWGPTANPNTADGEIQGVSAFARAAINATGWRRTAARLAALIALAFIALYVIAGVVLASR